MDTYPDQAVAVLDPGGYTYILVAWYEKMSPAYFFATVKTTAKLNWVTIWWAGG